MIFLPTPLRRFPLLPGCLLFWAACSNAGEQTQPVWKYPPDLPGAKVHVYKRVGPVELKAWVFNPPETFPSRHRPAIVFFFGGGWKGGTPGQFYPQCHYLASRGMVALTVDYRVKGRHGVPVGACLEDAKSAIRWVRENAIQLGIDPDRVVASGGAAGGHLAAALAMVPGFEAKGENLEVSSRPNAMALYNPAVILGKVDGKQQLPAEKIEDLRTRTANRIQQLSPYQHVQSGLPPSIIFHGSEDQAVPLWTVRKFQEALKAKRNRCELKIYGGAPHGFFNTGRPASEEKMDREQQWYASTTRQLDQFLISLGYLDGQPAIVACEKSHLNLRTDFSRSLAKILKSHKAHVAFMGGSITQMNGYRPIVEKWLRKKFPQADFQMTNAGIASTCSTSGAFRLRQQVLEKGKVDLFIVEFAVNDDQDARHSARQCIRGMEGIVRQLRREHPGCDIVMVHFVNPAILGVLDQGKRPLTVDNHEKVARHYRVSSVNVAGEVSHRIREGRLTWQEYGGTHPGVVGNRLAAEMICELLDAGWANGGTGDAAKRTPQLHQLPEKPLDPGCYANGRFLETGVQLGDSWQHKVPPWDTIPGSLRKQFAGVKCFYNTQVGEDLKIVFRGSTLGAYVLAGPDAGILEVSVDGGSYRRVDLFHRFSKGLHYPRTVLLADDLEEGEHRARVRVSSSRNWESVGSVARIMHFVAN